MPGTIFGIALSQQITANARPMSGCLLYLYEANTTTPATAFQDYGLTTGLELTNPIEADANGRIPSFWLADGAYRVRLTDSSGVVQFDEPYVVALGPSSGSGGGGGVDANAIHQTGDFIWRPTSGTRAGWVRANGRTIGSSTSSATERANSDCESLFLELWNSYSNTLCPVTGGRGANAAADWAANKRIATLDMRNISPTGLDDMGNSAASLFTDVPFERGDATTAASIAGASLHTLTSGEMPSHTHTASVTDPGHVHDEYAADNTGGPSFTVQRNSGAAGSSLTIQDTGSATTGITVANANTGGGTAHNNMQRSMLGTWYIRL